jgi:hypothetical protein
MTHSLSALDRSSCWIISSTSQEFHHFVAAFLFLYINVVVVAVAVGVASVAETMIRLLFFLL